MSPAPQSPFALLDLDALLSEEERAIRDVVRQYVDDRIKPEVADWFETGTIPARELAREMGSLGLLGMHLEGYGCAGTSATAYGLACLELEAGDSGIRSLVSVQGSLAMYAIHAFGSEEHKQQWLPRMAAGEAIGCFGLTEPDFGSNPSGMRTAAKRDGDDWILDGTKMWITNGTVADVAVVWARTDEGIRGFVVPTDAPGFTAREIHKKLSLRASVTAELILEGVRLPAGAVLPGVTGLRGPLSCLNEARFGIVFGTLGAARDCLETAIAYAIDREQFDRPIAGFQLTQKKFADMALELDKGFLLALHLGRLKDAHTIRPEQISVGKLNNARESLAIARECRSILGGNGITLEYPVIRHMNNLESVFTYEGTNEMHTLVVGEALTGLAAYRGVSGIGRTSGALDGVVVADFSRVLAGPYATMLLADLGAEVVKVERPGAGDDTRSWGPPYDAEGGATYFGSVNRNKRSVALDLGTTAGLAQARDLALRADVLVENFKPGGLERLGLGYGELSAHNPRLVMCSISGFGSGAGAELPGYDLLVQAMGGLMSVTGPEPGHPTKVGVALVDVVTGLHAVYGILAALRHRDLTGAGQHVEVNLLSSLLSAMVNQSAAHVAAGVVPGILGNDHPSITPYGVYATGDRPLVLAVGNDRQFRALVDVLGSPSLADDARFATNPERVANRAALRDLLERSLGVHGADHWYVGLTAAGVPCGPINDLEAAVGLASRLGLDPVVGVPGSVVPQIANPLRMSATPPTYRSAPPALGSTGAGDLAGLLP